MAKDFLKDIVDYKLSLLKKKQAFYEGLKQNIQGSKHTRYSLFKKAVLKAGKINLIAEIKKASPSGGLIRDNFDLLQLAKIYVEHGADAISILTEDKFFLGKPNYIKKVGEHFKVPILTKDFIIAEIQIYEAFILGASAILLIVAILNNEQLKAFIHTAANLDIDCLVEVHDEDELNRSLDVGAELIGINHRNLHTFELDLRLSEQLIPKIPQNIGIVSESGIKSHQEVVRLKELGAHAVLIGETFMRAQDVGKKMKEIMEG